jgi:3-oxoacyl-[acyl-carrier-protein] synthase II
MAIEDAGLIRQQSAVSAQRSELKPQNSKIFRNAAVIIGSSRGGITSLENAIEKHLLSSKPVSAYLMSASTINMASSYISMKLETNGPALGISTACASGTNAVGEAFKMIRHGEIRVAIAGGAEAPICRLAVGGYGTAGALSKRNSEPRRASRPFDKGRDGFVIAEGAAVLVLEEMDHALARGSRIYAELAGYGTSSDARHQTKPDSEGESLAINGALKDAHVSHSDVDYINAHATSTPLGDAAESKAIRKVFGRRAHEIPVHKGTITPTINLEVRDPDCDLHFAATAIEKNINIAVSDSFGFGGVNAVLVLKKFLT